jgi:gas vesicle protein
MKDSTKRLLGGAVVGAALGAIGAIMIKKDGKSRRARRRENAEAHNTWARPGMKVVFRAEVMPGRETSERTFQVTSLLPSGRVLLDGVIGEHAEKEFQPIR